jgi:hypothetical protein
MKSQSSVIDNSEEAIDIISILSPKFEAVINVDLGYGDSLVDWLIQMAECNQLTGDYTTYTREELRLVAPRFKIAMLKSECEGSEFSWWTGLTRKWIEQELATVYSLALENLKPEMDSIEIKAGVAPGTGSRHFRSNKRRGFIIHDLFDRMLINVVGHAGEECIVTHSEKMGKSGLYTLNWLISSLAADSFAEATEATSVHMQLLGNLELIGHAQTPNLSMAAMLRRNSSHSASPMPQESIISDLIIAFHEVSHMNRIDRKVYEQDEYTAMLIDHSINILNTVIKRANEANMEFTIAEEVASWLSNRNYIETTEFSELLFEADTDFIALCSLQAFVPEFAYDFRSILKAMFGITLVGASRKFGAALGQFASSEELLRIKAFTVIRFAGGALSAAKIVQPQNRGDQDYLANEEFLDNLNFAESQTAFLIEILTFVEVIFLEGLAGNVSYHMPWHILQFFDRYAKSDNPLTPKNGTVSIEEIAEWANKMLLIAWRDNSKPMRGMRKAAKLSKYINSAADNQVTEAEEIATSATITPEEKYIYLNMEEQDNGLYDDGSY